MLKHEFSHTQATPGPTPLAPLSLRYMQVEGPDMTGWNPFPAVPGFW